MTDLKRAIGNLRPSQRRAIELALAVADGETHLEEIAFVAEMLERLIDLHEDTPVGWALVTARKALLSAAERERIIPGPRGSRTGSSAPNPVVRLWRWIFGS